MTLTDEIKDLEKGKFIETSSGNIAIRTSNNGIKRYPTSGVTTITVSAGTGTHTTTFSFFNTIKQIMIKPVNETDTFNWEITESTLPTMKLQKSKSNTGSLSYLTEFPATDILKINITNASVDGDYSLVIIYE